jgi:hypothetical protein
MKNSGRTMWKTALLAVAAGVLMVPAAEAVVGRPGTPVSVAGVARRSVRRTTVVVASSASHAAEANAAAQQQTAAANQAAAESAAAAASAQQAAAASQQAAAATQAAQGTPALASLPAGCSPAGGDYNCSGTYYRPYFISGTLVYKQVPAPQ